MKKFSVSSKKNRIFICLLNTKKIEIINYNQEGKLDMNSILTIDENYLFSSKHFIKCIELTNENIAASDNEQIFIFSENENKFTVIKKIIIPSETVDLLLINKDNFISSQPDGKTLKIFDTKNFQEVSTINNIDCRNDTNSLFNLNNEYIVINCYNGIGLLSVKNKELVQYIEKFSILNKAICCG